MNISGRSDVIVENGGVVYNRLGMIVKNISTTVPAPKKFVNMTAKLMFINNVTNPKYDEPVVASKIRIFYVRDGIPLQLDELQQLTVYFRKLFVETDTDKFFLSNQLVYNTTFYDE